jgi:hypothetical protein
VLNQRFGDLTLHKPAEKRQPDCAFNSFPFYDLLLQDRN